MRTQLIKKKKTQRVEKRRSTIYLIRVPEEEDRENRGEAIIKWLRFFRIDEKHRFRKNRESQAV